MQRAARATMLMACSGLLGLLPMSSASGEVLLVGNKGEDTLSLVGFASGRECARLATGKAPHEIAVSTDGRQAAVVSYGGAGLDIFDIRRQRLVRQIDLGSNQGPHGIVWQKRNRIIAVTDCGNSLVAIDPRSRHFEVLPTGQRGSHMVEVSRDGARTYLDHYVGLYRQAVGPDLMGARGIRALLNDSIESGPANWTPRLRERFIALRGYDPLPWMPALSGTIIGSRSQTDRFLFDYRRTLSDLMASEHYGTIAAFAREQGLVTYGEAQEHGRLQLGDDLAMRRHAAIPMAALWTFPREKGPQPNYLVDMRGAASIANIHGKPVVAAEMMTSLLSPWAFGPADLKRVADLAFVSGINRPIIHTSVHVPVVDKKPGLSLFIFGQYFNRNESWAKLARPWVDYLARNAFLLQQGRTVTDLAYYYGEEAPLTGLYSDRTMADAPRRHGYDFVNSDTLMQSLANDGADLVTPGGARYRALYLGGSARHMTLATLRRIDALVRGGATVIGPTTAVRSRPARRCRRICSAFRRIVARRNGRAGRKGPGDRQRQP